MPVDSGRLGKTATPVRKTLLILGLSLAAPAPLLADEIFLKGAGSVSGRITEESPAMVMINTGDGIMGIPRERIDRVVKGRSPLDDYEERAKKLAPNDAKGWRELGRWAASAGISTQSREAYQKALTVDPSDAEAREALGFVWHNGTWMTEEDSYRAQGFVRYQGEWMTPAEVQVHEATAATEQAARDAEQRAIDAEIAQAEAEHAAQEAEKRAEEAEEDARRWSNPIYWGGWGYGASYWPANTSVTWYR